MGNAQKDNASTSELSLKNVKVQAQVTTLYTTSESLVESVGWNRASLTLADKVLKLVIFSDKKDKYEIHVEDNLEIVQEQLTERKVKLRYVQREILTLVQVQFPTTQTFLMWFLCFRKAKRPNWDPETTAQCKVQAIQECSNKFTWRRRQHHCRNCGHAVCSSCSRHRAALQSMGYPQDQRICSSCSLALHPEGKSRPRSQVAGRRNRGKAASVSYMNTIFLEDHRSTNACRSRSP